MATGCYIPEYLPASYKGVFFDAMDATSEHGRRGAVGEFPFGEETAYTDLGRKNRTYTIKARFVENSHVGDVDALIAAVESPGSGTLIHPTRGVINAACRSMKVRDDLYEEQGVSYADLEFIEANDWPRTMSFGDTILGLDLGGLLDVALDTFLGDFVPALIPFHRMVDVIATVADVIGIIRDEYDHANPSSSDGRVVRALADFNTILNDTTLLQDPKVVSKAISVGMAAISRSLTATTKFEAMRRIANAAAHVSTLPSDAGVAQDAVYTYTRVIAGAYLGQATAEKQFATVDDALFYLGVAFSVLDGEATIAYERCKNQLFLALREYTTDTQTVAYNKAYTLPGIVQYDFNGSVHPLIAAYHIYGDAKRHREIEAANLIGFNGKILGPVVGVG